MAFDGVGVGRHARAGPVGAAENAESEETLVDRAKTDPQAFAALYDRYARRVYRYCLARLGTKEAAEDATAQTFAAALAALPRYRERGSFATWLFAIAHNAIADAGRAARPERSARPLDDAAATALPDPAAGPEEVTLAAEARASVLNLLPRLPDDQRRVLELRLAGLSGPEVARALGRSHGSVRVAQTQAVARALGRSHGSVRVAQTQAVARFRTLLAEPTTKPNREGHDG